VIFARSLIKEILITMFWVTGIILVIFISNQFVRHLGASASGQLFGAVIWKLILIQIPYYLGLFLPLGLYLGIILTLSRLVVDHELMVWWASGVSTHYILKTCVFLGMMIALIVGILNLWVNPLLLQKQQILLHQAKSATLLQAISPGRFVAFGNGRSVAYVAKIYPDQDILEQVFLAVKTQNDEADNWDILLAKNGRIQANERDEQRYLLTRDGYRYIGQPGRADYRVIKYGSYALLSQSGGSALPIAIKENAMTVAQLLQQGIDKNKVASELLWRLSLPISAIILTILAIALSETRVRQGRYAKVLPAIVLYIVYANLLLLSRQIASGTHTSGPVLSPWLMFGLVHLAMLMFGGFWYCSQQGVFTWHALRLRFDGWRRNGRLDA